MNQAVRQYEKALKKLLPCTPLKRRKITAPFRTALNGYAEEHENVNLQMLSDAFGTPEEMAQTLRLQITPKDAKAYRTYRVVLYTVLGVLIAAFIAFTIYVFCFKTTPIIANESITSNGEIISDTP